MSSYRIIYNNQEVGPMTLDQLRAYNINPNTMIRVNDGPWVSAFTVPEVMAILNPQQPVRGADFKDHTIAGIFALLLGGLGIQYFYIGKATAGILCILISLVSCGLWTVITLVQGILMLMMTQEEFERKYVNNPATFPLF